MDDELKKKWEVSDNPEKRIKESTGDALEDRIAGILVGFAQKLRERDNWIDIITTRRARVEIHQLLKDHKDGKI